MATQTPNYNLTKPDSTEAVDIAVINGNMDKVDAALKTNATNISLLQHPRPSFLSNSNYSENGTPQVVERSGWVLVHFRFRCDTPAATQIALYSALPRPLFSIYETVQSLTGSQAGLGVEIATNGNLLIRYGTAGNVYYGTLIYPKQN